MPGTASIFSEKLGTKKLWITSSDWILNTTGRSTGRYSTEETTCLPAFGYENSKANWRVVTFTVISPFLLSSFERRTV